VEKLCFGNQTRATQRDVGVVIRDALRDPQHFRVILLRVVERPERVGPDSFHVPEMKELVGNERQKTAVVGLGPAGGVWGGGSPAIAAANVEAETRITERGRVQVLEAAPGVLAQV